MSYNLSKIKKLFKAETEINFRKQLNFLFESVAHSSASVIQHSKKVRDGKGTVFANNITSSEKRSHPTKIVIKSDTNLDYLMKACKEERYVISNATYYGGKQNIDRLSEVFYLFLDFDHVSEEQVKTYLELSQRGLLPLANIVELSGKGLHLYFKLANPINRCFERQKLMLSLVRSIGRLIANALKVADPTNNHFKYDELNLVHNHTFAGVKTKDGNSQVTSYFINPVLFSAQDLNKFTNKLSIEQVGYCDYDVNFVDEYRQVFELNKIKSLNNRAIKLRPEIFLKYLYLLLNHNPQNSYEGQRYKILSNFIALGKKCYIPQKELKLYVRKIVNHFNKFDSQTIFSKQDIQNAWSRGTSRKVYQNQINKLMGKKMPFWSNGIISQKEFEKNILNSELFLKLLNGEKTSKTLTKKYDKLTILEINLNSIMQKKNKTGKFLINKKTTYKELSDLLRTQPQIQKMRFSKKEIISAIDLIKPNYSRRIPNFTKNTKQIFKSIAIEVINKPSLISKGYFKELGYEINSHKFNKAWKQANKLTNSLIDVVSNILEYQINYQNLYKEPEFIYYKNNIEEVINSILNINNYPKEWSVSDLITLNYKLLALYEYKFINNKKIYIHNEVANKQFNLNIKQSIDYVIANSFIRRTKTVVKKEQIKQKEMNQKIKEIIQDKKIFKTEILNNNTNINIYELIDFEYCNLLYAERFNNIPKTKYWKTIFKNINKFINEYLNKRFIKV